MVVVHIITSLRIGGAETALVNLLEEMRGAQYEHHVFYMHSGPNIIRIERLGIAVYQVCGMVSAYDPVGVYRLIRQVKKVKPDLIHSALWSANMIARFVGWLFVIPVICDLHGDCRYYGRVRNVLEKLCLFFPARYVAVSDSARNSYAQTFQIDRDDIILVRNGINCAKVQRCAQRGGVLRSDLGFTDDDIVVGTVGRLVAIKQYDLLLRAGARVIRQTKDSRIKLCFVGDGPERASLESLAQELRIIDQVYFAGARADACCFYPLFDCFALSSQSEGLSVALLEALCFGLPVVTTHDREHHDVITHGTHGLLVPVNDEQKLYDALKELLCNKIMRDAMRVANIDLVKTCFNVDLVVSAYDKLYHEVTKKGC